MNSNLKPKMQKHNIVIQELENEVLIYKFSDNKAFCLNQTSALVWQASDGKNTISAIAELLTNRLKKPVSEDFVWLAISDLQKEGLIEVESRQPFFEGKTRREAIRKIGLASMIALPVISSLVAPRAVDAQSGCRALNQICTPNNFTQSNCCNGLRCNTFCENCRAINAIYYFNAPLVTSAQCSNQCNLSTRKNLCCNSSSPFTFTFSPTTGNYTFFCG